MIEEYGDAPHQNAVDRMYITEKAKREVKRRLDLEEKERIDFQVPEAKTLRQRLEENKPEERVFIQDIWPKNGNVYIAAEAGSGKTTFNHNLIRSAADGVPFLDKYAVEPIEGKVVLIDLEMNDELTDLWLLDQDIVNQDKIIIWTFRGDPLQFDITDKKVAALWSAKLKELNAEVVILDCLTPLLNALGLDENRDLRKILYPFYAMLKQAGVAQGSATHHAGWNGRSRGDSAAVGIADVNIEIDDTHTMRITKTRLRNAPDKVKLSYDMVSRHLTATDFITEVKPTKEEILNADVGVMVSYVKTNPNLSKNVLTTERNAIHGLAQKRAISALVVGVELGLLVETKGARGSLHYAIKE